METDIGRPSSRVPRIRPVRLVDATTMSASACPRLSGRCLVCDRAVVRLAVIAPTPSAAAGPVTPKGHHGAGHCCDRHAVAAADDLAVLACASKVSCQTGRRETARRSMLVIDSSGCMSVEWAVPMAASASSMRNPPWTSPAGCRGRWRQRQPPLWRCLVRQPRSRSRAAPKLPWTGRDDHPGLPWLGLTIGPTDLRGTDWS